MPLPNRVAPDGRLFADAARGLLLGNRGGRFHDPATRTLPRRTHATRQWICCLLSFKGRSRAVWSTGYTELFFCDEVTALAAGHRPCMECRRADALAYRAALTRGLGLTGAPSFPSIDGLLDGQRREGRRQRVHTSLAEALPDGAMIADGARFLAVKDGRLLSWTAAGYEPCARALLGPVSVLTPPASLAALGAGYAPIWHPSAASADAAASISGRTEQSA